MAQGEHLLLLPRHSSSPSPPLTTAPPPSPLHQSLFCLPLCRQIIESGSATLGGAGGHFGKDPQLPSSAGCGSPCSVLDNSSFRSPRFSPQFRFAAATSSSGQPPGVVGLAILVESEASPLPGEDSPSPRFGPVNRRWADHGCFSHPSPRNPNTNYNYNTNINTNVNTNVNTGPSPGPSPSAPNKCIGESESPNAHRQRSPPIWIGSKSDLQWAKRGQRRIFSTGSPISGSDEDLPLPSDFLQACFFCKLAFCTGKDIYMYRGDRGFCSVECREQQILMDEERTSSSMKKKAPHDTTKMAAGA